MNILELLQRSVVSYFLAITLTLAFVYFLFHILLYKFGWAAPCKERKKIILANGDILKVVAPCENVSAAYAYAYIQQCGYRILTLKECESLRTDERSRKRLSFVIARNEDGTFYSVDMSHYFLPTRISSNFNIEGSLILIKEHVEAKEPLGIEVKAAT